MDPGQWQRIRQLFNEAVILDASEREAYLRKIRKTDRTIYTGIVALLEADARDSAFTPGLGGVELAGLLLTEFTGSTIGPYIVEEEIGRGGMGAVYKALDSRLERYVALKFLIGSQIATDSVRNRFLTEAKAVSRLDHANICTIHDIGETDDGELYIAMAYYEGATLSDRLADSPVSLHAAVNWTIQIAEGLHYAHEKGVYHRDIKTANVFLADLERVKILDFGVAKLQGFDLTEPGLRVGTASYMSPEQVLGSAIDQRSDIWSLGVVFYEMIAGTRPFSGDSASDIVNQVLRVDIVAPTERVNWLPPAVDKIIECCLARDIHARYPDCRPLLDDLEHLGTLLSVDSRLASREVGQGVSGQIPTTGLTHFRDMESRQITVVSCTIHAGNSRAAAGDSQQGAEAAMRLQRYCEAYALSEGIAYVNSLDSLVTLCFGYPKSREHSVVRAVRAALALREQLAAELQSEAAEHDLRFGVHTGNVIVDGSMESTSGAIQRLQGDVHVIANRIQELGTAGSIVLSQATVSLLRGAFRVEEVGRLKSPHSASEVTVLELTGGSGERDMRRAGSWGEDRTVIGRITERAMLKEAWDAALDGDGRIIAIRGEAGIGKSRLMQLAASEMVENDENSIVLLQCSAYHRNSFLFPCREWLRAELGDAADSASLDRYLSGHKINDRRSRYLLAELLDIGVDGDIVDEEPALATPETKRLHTLQAIADLITKRSSARPLLILAEDLHWADASTLDLIQHLVDQGPVSCFLLLLSFRPRFRAEWLARAHVSQITLGKLTRSQSLALAKNRIGAVISDGLVQRIAEKSDGVPLFIEELCSTFRDSASMSQWSDETNSDVHSADMAIPETLRDSLTARLDRNIDYKPVAQLASVLGRQFEYKMISKAWTGTPQILDAALEYLVESELLFQTGVVPEARFVFKHALIQDAAYSSLVRSTRATYHQLVADVVERFFPTDVQQHPEVLANHFSRAALPRRAVPYWLAAAKNALQQSALIDAIAHARRGLDDLTLLEEGPEKLQLELRLLMTLGPALMAHYSWSMREVEQCYERARRICTQMGNVPQLFPVLYGLYTYHCVVGNHAQGESLNRMCLQVANDSQDEGLQLEANMLKGMTHFFYGELVTAREFLEKSASRYDPETFGDHCYLYGQDPGMVANSYLALTLALQGRGTLAKTVSLESLQQTRDLKHPFSLAYALNFAAWLHLMLDDTEQGKPLAMQAQALCEDHRIGIMLAMSRVLTGWAKFSEGSPQTGIVDIRRGIQHFEELGAGVLMPCWHAVLGLAELAQDNVHAALAAVDKGLSHATSLGEHWSTAELHRVRCAGLLQQNKNNTAAIVELRKAVHLAQKQGARLFECRSLIDLVAIDAATDTEAARLREIENAIESPVTPSAPS